MLGVGFALGLLLATYNSIDSHITGFEWTLERCETDFKYLFVAIGFPSLVLFSCAGIDSGLGEDDGVSTELRNDFLPEMHSPDDEDHHTTTQQYDKEPFTVNLITPTLSTTVILNGLRGQHIKHINSSQDFTVNEAMKKMKFIGPTAFLKTLKPSTLVLKQPSKVQNPSQ